MTSLEDDVIELSKDLVAIDSVNPSLVAGGAGEGEIARYVDDWARSHGLETELVEPESERPSVLIRSGQRNDEGPRLLLCGHLDTVGFGGMTAPTHPRIDGDRLYGRGTYDMKAGLAAALVACREVAREGLPIDVMVAAVADEEHASGGVRRLLPDLRADAAIVTEPTDMAIGVAHKGFAWLDVEVTGVPAHGSRPELGTDAIAKMGPVLVNLEELNRSLSQRHHELLGPATVHASLIVGGTEASTIPERCVLTIERRTLPDEDLVDVEREVERLLARCRTADSALVAEARTLLHRPSMQTPLDQPVVHALSAAHERVRGVPAETAGMSFWADSAFIASQGTPTVLFGPSGEGAHADVEWVSVSATVECTTMLVNTARTLSRA